MRTRVIFRIAAAAFLLIALASSGLAQTTGGIVGVTLERLDEPSPEVIELIRAGEFRASLSTQ